MMVDIVNALGVTTLVLVMLSFVGVVVWTLIGLVRTARIEKQPHTCGTCRWWERQPDARRTEENGACWNDPEIHFRDDSDPACARWEGEP